MCSTCAVGLVWVAARLATALGPEEVEGQFITAAEVVECAAGAERQHGRMLHHEQRVFRMVGVGGMRGSLLEEMALPVERLGIRHLLVPQIMHSHDSWRRSRREHIEGAGCPKEQQHA